MTDFDDASVNENGEPLGNTPESPTPADAAPIADAPPVEIPAPVAPSPEPALFGWGAPPVPEPPVEPAPASPAPPIEPQPAFETPAVISEPALEVPQAPVAPEPQVMPEAAESSPALEVAAPAVAAAGFAAASADGFSDGLTGELRALTDALEPPLDETAAPAETPAVAGESLDDIAPGTVAAEGEQAVEVAAVEGAAAPTEGEAAEGAEAPAEGAEGTEAAAEGAEVAVAEGDEAALEGVQGPRTKVSWWPFIGYIVVWLGAAAYAVWQLQQLPVGQAAYETNLYTMSMLGGLVLLALGPVLLLIVWLASWIGRENRRIGLMFISALLKGAASTLIGAIIWIGALMLVDYLRLGRPF